MVQTLNATALWNEEKGTWEVEMKLIKVDNNLLGDTVVTESKGNFVSSEICDDEVLAFAIEEFLAQYKRGRKPSFNFSILFCE